jgi:hypothetical protein
VLINRTQRAWQDRMMQSLTPEQREQFVTYSNKATGWFVVGGGAALIAVKETVELVETMGWSDLAALPLVVGAAVVALAFTVHRMRLAQRALGSDDVPGRSRRRRAEQAGGRRGRGPDSADAHSDV